MLPTDMYPTGAPVQYYGHKYPIQDCRSGSCLPGYLLWNGYIPAHQINSHDPKTGQPNGVMGVPSDYKPAASPLWPYPADYNSRSGSTDPNYDNYGSNIAFLPVTDSTTPYQIDLTPIQRRFPGRKPSLGLEQPADADHELVECGRVHLQELLHQGACEAPHPVRLLQRVQCAGQLFFDRR